MDKSNPEITPFLKRLPIEIRIEVYRNLLSTRYTKKESTARKQCSKLRNPWPFFTYDLDPTILRASRQVYSEASTVLYNENLFVRLRSTYESIADLMNTRGIPILLEGRRAENSKHCAMSVDFHHLDTTHRLKSQKHWPSYIIVSDDLRLLCQGLLIEHTHDHGFKLYEFQVNIHRASDDMLSQYPARNSPQRRLLEPFTVLHNVSHIKIAGPVNERYGASIAARMSGLGPTLTQYLNQVTEVTQKGHEHFDQNDLKRAMQAYKMAYSLLVSTCLRPKDIEINWIGFEPEHSILDLYVILMRCRAFVHFELDELEDARIWAYDVLQHGPLRTGTEYQSSNARLVYIAAIVSARSGDRLRAVIELWHGWTYLCRDIYKDTRLVELRREALSLVFSRCLGQRGFMTWASLALLWRCMVGPIGRAVTWMLTT